MSASAAGLHRRRLRSPGLARPWRRTRGRVARVMPAMSTPGGIPTYRCLPLGRRLGPEWLQGPNRSINSTWKTALSTAFQYHQQGFLDQAAQIYQLILAGNPENTEALHLLGLVALQQANPARAVELIRRAIALHPRAAVLHANLAEAYRLLNQFEERRPTAVGRRCAAPAPLPCGKQQPRACRLQALGWHHGRPPSSSSCEAGCGVPAGLRHAAAQQPGHRSLRRGRMRRRRWIISVRH